MRILFVYREFPNLPNTTVKLQAESIEKEGIEVLQYIIKVGGILGYLSAIRKLRIFITKNNINLIHSHYGITSIITRFSSKGIPVVASLMGSDLYNSYVLRYILSFFSHFLWRTTIVKSNLLKALLKNKNANVIPNGVSFDLFYPIEKKYALSIAHFNPGKNILFIAAFPDSFEKNIDLARISLKFLDDPEVKLCIISDIKHSELVYYFNAADVLLLTSLYEGSPNVIKEAMACSCPIVSTDVGDVRQVISGTEGCFLTTFNPEDVAEKIKLALNFGKRTNGREHIRHLDSKVIAKKIVAIYEDILIANKI